LEKLNERVAKFRRINWLTEEEKGTKSNLYELILRDPGKTIILKEYKKNPLDLGGKNTGFNDFIAEKAMLKVALKYHEISEIFPTLLSDDDPFFDSKQALLVETVVSKTLEQSLLSNEKVSNIKYILKTIETFAKFFSRMPNYKQAIENEMNVISSGKISEIQTRNFYDYMQSFKKHFEYLFSKKDKAGFDAYGHAALNYFGEQILMVNDAYPFNLAPERFIDVGNLKKGAMAMQLGCLFTPIVLKTLKKEKATVESVIYRFCENYGKISEPEKLIRGTLNASVYTNLRCAAGIKKRKRSKKAKEYAHEYVSAAKEQAGLLASKDERASPLYESINPEAVKW
jgi:hypothetical protein